MSKGSTLLDRMRNSPAGDWTIADVSRLCDTYAVECSAPKRGDHFKVSHSSQMEILTIPAHRPIKPIYIRKLVKFVESVLEAQR